MGSKQHLQNRSNNYTHYPNGDASNPKSLNTFLDTLVVGPSGGSSTNNAIAVWDGTTGRLLKDSSLVLSGGSVLGPASGGTGIANNAASTLTISGNFATTLTVSGTTSLTLPASGTLAILGANTFTGTQTLVAGTTSVAPLQFQSGTNLTTPTAGAMEYDGKVPYYDFAASQRGVLPCMQFISLTATYTLGNNTNTQAVFNTPSNGTLTVLGSTTYFFHCQLNLSSMSATSGNMKFDVLGAGTASFTSAAFHSVGVDTSAPGTAGSQSGCFTATNASSGDIVGAAVNTGCVVDIWGIFRVSSAGTIIPSVALTNAAAAVVGVNSFFLCYPVGTNTVQSVGNWS
jgi:hypothetical protein